MVMSDYLAVLAVFISAISLIISWRHYLRDSSELRLSLEFQIQSGQGSCYKLIIVNAGRRPLTINKCYARLKSGKAYPVFDTPTIMNETDRLEFDVPLYGFRNSISHPLDIIAFEVEETTGRIRRIETRKIARDIRKVWMSKDDWLKKS